MDVYLYLALNHRSCSCTFYLSCEGSLETYAKQDLAGYPHGYLGRPHPDRPVIFHVTYPHIQNIIAKTAMQIAHSYSLQHVTNTVSDNGPAKHPLIDKITFSFSFSFYSIFPPPTKSPRSVLSLSDSRACLIEKSSPDRTFLSSHWFFYYLFCGTPSP